MLLTRKRWRIATALFTVLSFGVGCGKSDGLVLAPVTGVVLLDGVALANAKVEFNPVEVQPTKKGAPPSGGSFAVTDKDGKYSLRFDAKRLGAVLGEHSVRITTAGQQHVPDGQLPKPEKVPAGYNVLSKLRQTVTAGSNVADFQLSTSATAKR